MARTRRAPLVSSEDGVSALVFENPTAVAASGDRDGGSADAPELAAAVANALSDAAKEAQWRDQALAAILT